MRIEVAPAQGHVLPHSYIQFAAMGFDQLGNEVPLSNVEWQLSNASIAQHMGAGLIYTLAEGETSVFASYAGVIGQGELSIQHAPTPTSPPSATPTNTPTRTATATRTSTPSQSATRTATRTATPTFTRTRTPTSTATVTRTPTASPTSNVPNATPTRTPTRTATASATPSRTPTRTSTPTVTPTRTATPSVTPTVAIGMPQQLIAGNGWNGPTRGTPPISASVLPIARWDDIQFRNINDIRYPSDPRFTTVGVVAFHKTGIASVQLALDGGAWVSISKPTLNPATGVIEYWAIIDTEALQDAEHEVRAIITASSGDYRVLEGTPDPGGRAGEFSLFMRSNNQGSRPEGYAWVDPILGVDAPSKAARIAQVNNPNTPFKSIFWAAEAIAGYQNQNAAGGTIYLAPGSYEWGLNYSDQCVQTPSGTSCDIWAAAPTDRGYLTIMPRPGAVRSQVRFSAFRYWGYTDLHHIRLKDVTVATWLPVSTGGTPWKDYVWADAVHFDGGDRVFGDAGIGAALTIHITDSITENVYECAHGTVHRNNICRHITSDSLEAPRGLIVNYEIEDIDRTQAHAWLDECPSLTTRTACEAHNVQTFGCEWRNNACVAPLEDYPHPDVFQFGGHSYRTHWDDGSPTGNPSDGHFSNLILYNIKAHGRMDTEICSVGNASLEEPIRGVAMVNWLIDFTDPNGGSSGWIGGHIDHFLMHHVSVVTDAVLTGVPDTAILFHPSAHFSNLSIRNSVLGLGIVGTDQPLLDSSNIITNNHFLSNTYGTAFTSGLPENLFLNPAQGALSPGINSPLRNRAGSDLTTHDLLGQALLPASQSAIGALQPTQ